MCIYFSKFLSYNDNQVIKNHLLDWKNSLACIKSARAQLRAQKLRLIFTWKRIFMVKRWFGVIKSMDNLLNFIRLIMMERQNPFHIDKTISFLYHETRVCALVRAKGLKIWIMKKFLFKTFLTYTGIIFHL